MDYRFLADILGWIGSIELLTAYFLVSYQKISPSSDGYQWLNLTGSIFLLINTLFYGAYPSSFLNVIWGFIALVAIYRIYRSKVST